MTCGCEFDRLTDAAYGEIVVIDTVGCQFSEAVAIIEAMTQADNSYDEYTASQMAMVFLAKVGRIK